MFYPSNLQRFNNHFVCSDIFFSSEYASFIIFLSQASSGRPSVTIVMHDLELYKTVGIDTLPCFPSD